MAKVYLMCGKICSGKSTHAAELRKEKRAVVLSVDEITLALFGQDAGENHDEYVRRCEEYLYSKSLEVLECGIDVVLDWGFWTGTERAYAREFYRSRGIPTELHYIDIPDGEWRRRLEKRNRSITETGGGAYYVDDGLAAKFASIFEPPAPEEISLRITQEDPPAAGR